VAVAAAGLAEAKAKHYDVVVVDTAGRLGIDDELMARPRHPRRRRPDEVIFVLDAMIGQDAVTTAEAFREGVGFTGVVLTKLDGDARGGAALSVREVTGVPILFASSGEKLEDFDVFHPDRMASRIWHGRRPVPNRTGRAGLRRRSGRGRRRQDRLGELTLEDFLEQMLAIRRWARSAICSVCCPAQPDEGALAAVDDSQLDRVQAIIRGMTPAERADPKIIQRVASVRIANGSASRFLRSISSSTGFFEARKMMSQMAVRWNAFGRKGLSRKAAKNKKKGKKGGRGPTPPKRGCLWARGKSSPACRLPRSVEHAEGLDELPPAWPTSTYRS